MIVQFPSFYPDELVYSLLLRYYARSGYLSYSAAMEDLYGDRTARPSMEFLSRGTPEAMEHLTREQPLEDVILGHTMFPCYGRFLTAERRQAAFADLIGTQSSYWHLLPLPKNRVRRLRYCPLCAREDRETRGETYWHRVHQVPGMRVCPTHGCKLVETGQRILTRAKEAAPAAEEQIPETEDALPCENPAEREAAAYLAQVFAEPMDLACDVPIGKFLHAHMAHTPYRSIRGEQRNIALLYEDFQTAYHGFLGEDLPEPKQLQRIFSGYRSRFHEICLLALFLGIPAEELAHPSLPEHTQEERFDEQVRRMHGLGMSYRQVARQLHVAGGTAVAAGRTARKIRKGRTDPGGAKAKDWEKIDGETLPLVRDAIRLMQGGGDSRPMRITVHGVEQFLGLPSSRIAKRLPRCRAEVLAHQEPTEVYRAREVAWAAEKLRREGQPVNKKRVRELTNLRSRELAACRPYLVQFLEAELCEVLFPEK